MFGLISSTWLIPLNEKVHLHACYYKCTLESCQSDKYISKQYIHPKPQLHQGLWQLRTHKTYSLQLLPSPQNFLKKFPQNFPSEYRSNEIKVLVPIFGDWPDVNQRLFSGKILAKGCNYMITVMEVAKS